MIELLGPSIAKLPFNSLKLLNREPAKSWIYYNLLLFLVEDFNYESWPSLCDDSLSCRWEGSSYLISIAIH